MCCAGAVPADAGGADWLRREQRQNSDLQRCGMLPVSYTHLDVYKRQHTRHVAPAADGTAAGAAADGTLRRGVRPAAEREGLR